MNKTLFCKICQTKPLMMINANTQKELDQQYELMNALFGDTSCSDCVKTDDYIKKLSNGRK